MNEHRFILEPYRGMNTRYRCPGCGKSGTFVRYIDTETGEHLSPDVGRCNREVNCGYHFTPKQFFENNPGPPPSPMVKTKSREQPKPISFIPVEVFKQSLKYHSGNCFVRYLVELFGEETALQLISRYFIGTSKHWPGATVFWQIDIHGRVRTGKIMLYNPSTGRRIKEPFNYITWVHKALKLPDFALKQAPFGEHLLRAEPGKPVAIVEAEKTAIIASIYLPEFIWLAVGSLSNLTAERCQALKGRNVTLYPDLNGFEKWRARAKELEHLGRFQVSGLLESKATESQRQKGFDLADYLVQIDFRTIQKSEVKRPEPPRQKETPFPIAEVLPYSNTEGVREWDLSELERYFGGITLPPGPVQLNPAELITDVPLFIDSHLAVIRGNNGKQAFEPYLNRLENLKAYLENERN